MIVHNDCQSFVRHVLAEHRRLRALLEEIGAALSRLEPHGEKSVASMLVLLSQAREQLERHFGEEESEGCLAEAIARQPAVAAEVDEILAEHEQLRRDLDRVIARVNEAAQSGQSLQAAVAEFHRFQQFILAHEARENAVLERGFNVNLEEV